ncbi:ADP-ribosylation family protein [Ktedonosporobacter rubrisoli]|nr:ADP-ribosylation family protein [Ktedonosporobacter rubrisoli]
MEPHIQLEQIYGLQFPESLFTFWEFVQSHVSLFALLEMSLQGPFDILKGISQDEGNALWAARCYNDPPEFLTLASGHSDGYHWGYYIDDPQNPAFPVAAFYSHDAFEITVVGETLFEAARYVLELFYRDNLSYLQSDPGYEQSYEEKLNQLASLRSALQAYETVERQEVGSHYLRKYVPRRQAYPMTRDGMGIVVPAKSYVPIDEHDPFQLGNYVPGEKDVRKNATKAIKLLEQGYPGAALKLGKDLWIYKEFRETSYALLEAAYAALKRDRLREWLKVAIAYRQACEAKWNSEE